MSALKSKTGATILLIATFALGGVAGAVSYRLVDKPATASSNRSKGRLAAREIVDELARALELEEPQKERLAVIITESRDAYRALSRQFQPQYQALRDETNEKIRALLNEQQKTAFEKHLRELEGKNRSRNRN